MDFSRVELSDDDQAFQNELRTLLETLVTDEVIARDRQTGENFDEGVHLALAARGYLAADFRDEAGGGLSRVRRRIWNLDPLFAADDCTAAAFRPADGRPVVLYAATFTETLSSARALLDEITAQIARGDRYWLLWPS